VQRADKRRDWTPLAPGVTGFEHRLTIPQWRLDVRVMIYRKHVRHESPKNFQLDPFTPDDGHFEYYAVATNMTLGLPALFAFRVRPRRAGEDARRVEGGIRPRRRADEPLRRQ
jgi:hypothetical protein